MFNDVPEETATSTLANSRSVRRYARKAPVPTPRAVHKTASSFVALCDYTAKSDGELSFKKGDRFEVGNGQEGDWWNATCIATGENGRVPCNCVASQSSQESLE